MDNTCTNVYVSYNITLIHNQCAQQHRSYKFKLAVKSKHAGQPCVSLFERELQEYQESYFMEEPSIKA